MYTGEMLKKLARVVQIVGTAFSLVAGISLMIAFDGKFWWAGLTVAALGVFSAWVSYLILYAIGDTEEKTRELTRSVAALDKQMRQMLPKEESAPQKPVAAEAKDENHWVCRHCGHQNLNRLNFCTFCGENR